MSVEKLTLTTLDVGETRRQLEFLFGRDFESKPVADKVLARRGIKWFKLFELDLHLVPVKSSERIAFKHLYRDQLALDRDASDYGILSHIGFSVPDLTPYIAQMRKHSIQYQIRLRGDGVYQVYVFLKGVIPSYILELESSRMTLLDEEIKKFA
jgi:hypothetical protein